MDIDLTQIGPILIFLALTGYIAIDFYYSGYLGQRYRPRGGDLERFLHYYSAGITIIILVSLLFVILFNPIIPILTRIFFPEVEPPVLAASFITYILFLPLLLLIIILSLPFGWVIRKIKKRNPTEVTIELSKEGNETNDNREPIVASVIYDEDADYFFFIDKNENWGTIRKSLVNRIISKRKKSTIQDKKEHSEGTEMNQEKQNEFSVKIGIIFAGIGYFASIIANYTFNEWQKFPKWVVFIVALSGLLIFFYLLLSVSNPIKRD